MAKFATGSHYKKYKYTVRDLAVVLNRAEGTIRNDVSEKKLELSDFASVARYIVRHYK